MKRGLNIVAVLMILAGAIWSLQGIGILPGSFMSNDPRWLVIGIIVIVLGGVLLFSNTRRRTSR